MVIGSIANSSTQTAGIETMVGIRHFMVQLHEAIVSMVFLLTGVPQC